MRRQSMILGIDGGGSRGRMLAVAATGIVCAHAVTGPLNVNNLASGDILANLNEGVRRISETGRADGEEILACCAGIAGIKQDEDARLFGELLHEATRLPAEALEAVNDIVILQASGLGDAPGIALILGTGSHCHGRNRAGESTTCGGWGYLMDDCGGGYALGHAALRAAARMWDGRLPRTGLAQMVLDHLGITMPGASLRRVHNTDFGFDDVKALAPKITRLAAAGDPAAMNILVEAATEAAALVDTVCRRLDLGASPDIVITGGVAQDTTFQPLLLAALRRTMPGARLVMPDLPPVAGAVIRAATRAGIAADGTFLGNLRATLPTNDFLS